MANYLTEEDVKQKLGIPDFRHLTKDKVIQMASILPEMDSETAIKMIEQFPEFVTFSTNMVDHLNDMCSVVINENKHSSQQSFDAYKMLLEEFREQLKDPNLSSGDKHYFSEKMVEIADKISQKDTENKSFFRQILSVVAAAVGGIVLVAGSILGVKLLGDGKDI